MHKNITRQCTGRLTAAADLHVGAALRAALVVAVKKAGGLSLLGNNSTQRRFGSSG
jgi:hypothetical protein